MDVNIIRAPEYTEINCVSRENKLLEGPAFLL